MRIRKLELFSKNLQEQLQFYRNILGLEVLNDNPISFELKIGYSILKFTRQITATPYHIAFHIPVGQERKALDWLKTRVPILKDGNKEIVDFSSWKAKSIYFYDADKNVVEFISRKDFFPPKSSRFLGKSIVGISEIGLATTNVQKTFDLLHKQFHLEKFTGDQEVFCAAGDDEGLFIMIDRQKKEWFPSSDRAFASEFQIQFETGNKFGALAFKNDRIEIL